MPDGISKKPNIDFLDVKPRIHAKNNNAKLNRKIVKVLRDVLVEVDNKHNFEKLKIILQSIIKPNFLLISGQCTSVLPVAI
jgi:hypothetical protein